MTYLELSSPLFDTMELFAPFGVPPIDTTEVFASFDAIELFALDDDFELVFMYFSNFAKMCLPYVKRRKEFMCGRMRIKRVLRCCESATSIIFWTT